MTYISPELYESIKGKPNPNVKLVYVDLFCGVGGTTYGVEQARDKFGKRVGKVIACVNHDKKAINSHYLNHPDVKHFTEDIRILAMRKLVKWVKAKRLQYPNAKLVLWASLECTNFSNAKGGKPKNADSRTLAMHLFRYIKALNPDYIKIENVKEFLSWGPLDKKGKVIKSKKGSLFIRWRNLVCAKGYHVQQEILNSANYGSVQKRRRLFIIFGKMGLPISFPKPTHAKNPTSNNLFGNLKKWNPVRDVLELELEGTDIFERIDSVTGKKKKPLVDNTLERVYAGLIKYGLNDEHQFISQYYSGKPSSKVKSINSSCPTVTTIDHNSLVTMKVDNYLVEYYGNGRPISIDAPIGTITTKGRHLLLEKGYFIDRQFSGKNNHGSIHAPIGTVMTNPKSALVHVIPPKRNKRKGLIHPHYSMNGVGLETVVKAILILMKLHELAPVSLKRRFTEKIIGMLTVRIRIMLFMEIYNVKYIKSRMLIIKELLQIQGFPADYKLVGTKEDKCKFIGNAVETNISQKMCENLAEKLNNYQLAKAG